MKLWAAGIVVIAVVAAAAWWAGSESQSPQQAAARAEPPEPSWVTVGVEFRVLAATVVTRGNVSPATSQDIAAPSSVRGDPVVTRSAVEAGDVIDDGDLVAEISGRPVFAVAGEVPTYRSLQPGMEGGDVSALHAALSRLGYTIDEEGFGEQTKAAVTAFYAAAGYEPIPTSATFTAEIADAERAVSDAVAARDAARRSVARAAAGPPGSALAAAVGAVGAAERNLADAIDTRTERIALATAAVNSAKASRAELGDVGDVAVDDFNAANMAVDTAEVELASTTRNADDAVARARVDLDVARLSLAELRQSTDAADLADAADAADANLVAARRALDELRRVNGPTVPLGEIVVVAQMPARVLDVAAVGDASGSDGDTNLGLGGGLRPDRVATIASGDLIVETTLRPDQAGFAAVGVDVELFDEIRSTSYPATITSVTAEPVAGSDGAGGYPISITPDVPFPDTMIDRNVRVTLRGESTDTEQLVVPVAAVSSQADGTLGVNTLDDDSEPVWVEIVAGLSADGFVAVEPVQPDALVAGDEVVVGR